MRSRVWIGLAALFVALPIAAGAKGARPHRLSPAPGFSLSIPDGWMSCDAQANRTLGNADHPIVLNRLCAGLEGGGRIVLVYPDPSLPLMVMTTFTRQFSFPDKFLQAATPETILLTNDEICGRMIRSAFGAESCSVKVEMLAGHPVFSGEAVTMKKSVLKFYIASGSGGALMVLFATTTAVQPRVRAVMEEIANSLHIDPTPPQAPADFAQLSPGPGVTVSIPKNWIACDVANNALLGMAQDPDAMTAKMCNHPGAEKDTIVFDPRPLNNLSINFNYGADTVDADVFAKTLTPDALTQYRDGECSRMIKPLLDRGFTLDGCDAAAVQLAGHPARSVTVIASGPVDESKTKVGLEVRLIVIPYGKGVMTVRVNSVTMLKPMTDDEADAVVNSIAIP
jgi:hypothetical protein